MISFFNYSEISLKTIFVLTSRVCGKFIVVFCFDTVVKISSLKCFCCFMIYHNQSYRCISQKVAIVNFNQSNLFSPFLFPKSVNAPWFLEVISHLPWFRHTFFFDLQFLAAIFSIHRAYCRRKLMTFLM